MIFLKLQHFVNMFDVFGTFIHFPNIFGNVFLFTNFLKLDDILEKKKILIQNFIHV